MALLKEGYKNQFGVKQEYYRIVGININTQYKWVDISIGGYATQEARDNGSEPMNITKVRALWSDEEYGTHFSPRALEQKSLYTQAYEYIQTKDFFKDTSIV